MRRLLPFLLLLSSSLYAEEIEVVVDPKMGIVLRDFKISDQLEAEEEQEEEEEKDTTNHHLLPLSCRWVVHS